MTLEQRIFSKLEPHAKRIKDGEGNDFDFLPAVLLQLMEEQKGHARLMDDTIKILASIKSSAESTGAQSKAQVTSFEAAMQRRMDQIATALKDTQAQVQNSQFALSEQVSLLASAHSEHVLQTKESLSAIGQRIESFVSITQLNHSKCMRLLVAALVASTAAIGLAVAILQRQ